VQKISQNFTFTFKCSVTIRTHFESWWNYVKAKLSMHIWEMLSKFIFLNCNYYATYIWLLIYYMTLLDYLTNESLDLVVLVFHSVIKYLLQPWCVTTACIFWKTVIHSYNNYNRNMMLLYLAKTMMQIILKMISRPINVIWMELRITSARST